jgi:hypothetical protein
MVRTTMYWNPDNDHGHELRLPLRLSRVEDGHNTPQTAPQNQTMLNLNPDAEPRASTIAGQWRDVDIIEDPLLPKAAARRANHTLTGLEQAQPLGSNWQPSILPRNLQTTDAHDVQASA